MSGSFPGINFVRDLLVVEVSFGPFVWTPDDICYLLLGELDLSSFHEGRNFQFIRIEDKVSVKLLN